MLHSLRPVLLASLIGLAPSLALAQTQDPDVRETTLDEITVLGMPLREQVETFVDDVTAPATGWGPARWDARAGICVGVVNLRRDAAQAMADRVSEIADSLGLPIGEPGCSPNILIIASDNPSALTAALVERSPNAFRPRYSGAARSRLQLQRFVESDRPVRWWHVSLPVSRDTGMPAVRLPGRSAPMVRATASRLTTLVTSQLRRAYVIIDINQVEGLTFLQLSDYVAMVALAQIDPDADVSGFPTILNVVDRPTAASGLTDWDQAYLAAMYGTEMNQRQPNAQSGAIASMMYRDRRRAEAEAEAAAEPAPSE